MGQLLMLLKLKQDNMDEIEQNCRMKIKEIKKCLIMVFLYLLGFLCISSPVWIPITVLCFVLPRAGLLVIGSVLFILLIFSIVTIGYKILDYVGKNK